MSRWADIGDDAFTKRRHRQVRAITVRGERHSGTHPRLRAPLAGSLLSLLVLLSPELTLAPLNAVEPHRAAPAPIDRILEAVLPQSTRPIDDRPSEPEPEPADTAAFAAAMRAARMAGEAQGITFAVMRDGELYWTGADGRARESSAAITPSDGLVIGSVTKTFVAATILQLVEERALTLSDPVRDHLPGQAALSPAITIRQLLDHTSGLADLFNDTTRTGLEEHPEHAWSSAEVLDTLHAPWYEPGEGWAYANTNYFLLGLVVEEVTGSTLAQELDRRFLVPLELERTRVLTAAPDDGGPLAPAWTTIFWSSGAMTASAADLASWGDALYDGEILSDRSLAEMIELNRHDYGLGLQRIEVPGAVGYGHTGLLNTYTSVLLHLPEQDVTLALLVNRSQVDLGAMLAAKPPGGPSLLELLGVEVPKLTVPAP